MALKDLKKRIYNKDENFEERFKRKPLSARRPDVEPFWERAKPKEKFTAENFLKNINYKKIVLWGAFVVIALIIIGLGAYFFIGRGAGFNVGRLIELEASNPSRISSGDIVLWEVRYKNGNSVVLNGAELVFEFPEGSRPVVGDPPRIGPFRERRSIGVLEPGAYGTEEFRAVVFGETGAELNGKVSIEYRPENSSARYSKETDYSLIIYRSTLGVSIDMPEEVQDGQEIEARIHIVSSSRAIFKDLAVKVKYPSSFKYKSSDPLPFENDSIWKLGDLAPGEERIIRVRGSVSRGTVDAQTFRVDAGVYNTDEDSWVVFAKSSESILVRAPFLVVETNLSGSDDGVIAPGQKLNIVLLWRNNLPASVRNMFLETKIEGEALDLATISSYTGTFDGQTNTIKWLAGRNEELAFVDPGDAGRVEFSIVVKKPLTVKDINDKNFTANFISRIGASEVPQEFEGLDIEGVSELSLKVSTKIAFSQKGYYFDSRIQNTGSLPPKVGEETNYIIVWSLINSSNDLKNISVRASLPTYVQWNNVVVDSDDEIIYKSSTGEVIWNVDTVSAGTGYIRPIKEIAFQITLTPSITQVGNTPELISSADFYAEDAFTGTIFEEKGVAITTKMRDDPEISSNQRKVAN
ncbi:hypothetical protein ACFL3E_00360 [Patescibacteria group bacterium]